MHEARGPIPSSKFQVLLPCLLEIALPTAGYFLLHAAGVEDFWALTTVGVSTRGVAVANTVRRRRLDNLGLLVVLEVAFSIFLLFLARDPEILLLRPSLYLAVAGVYLLATLVARKPLVFEAAKPMASRRDPVRAAAYERACEHSTEFRGLRRELTLAWTVAILAAAFARAMIVLLKPVIRSVLFSHLPSLSALGALRYYSRKARFGAA